jgi:hypothetical protein
VIHEEVRYTPKELLDFCNLYRQKTGFYVCEWIVMVSDNDRRNRKLNQVKMVDTSL